MKTVLIRLEGPLQSWGTQGRFSIRDTDSEPSKSGVIGFVGAALGMPREDTEMLRRLNTLTMAVRVDREGTLLHDYHTSGGGVFRGERHSVWGTKDPVPTHRFYLADASFLVGLGADDHDLIDTVTAALQNPRWPLFLGRKSCAPALPPFVGVRAQSPVAALRDEPLPDGVSSPLRLLIECGAEDGAVPRNDVPLSFTLYERRHARRFVRQEWIGVDHVEVGE